MTTKIKVTEITLTDLVTKSLAIPNGWHVEVYVENGEVVFSAMLTANTWVGKETCPSEHLDNYIGDLHSLTWGEIEGFYERKDGKIELDNPYDGDQEGEYYSKVTIYSPKEAIEVLANYLDNDASEVSQLLDTIQHPEAIYKDKAVRCKICNVEIWEDVNCKCGIDGSDHKNLAEAYEEKAVAEKQAV